MPCHMTIESPPSSVPVPYESLEGGQKESTPSKETLPLSPVKVMDLYGDLVNSGADLSVVILGFDTNSNY